MLNLFDAAPISTRRKTGDGYLVAEARAARTGVQVYGGFEVGKPDMPVVRVYRPHDEVFNPASLGTYAHKPITVGHPPQGVTADTWKKFSVGHTSNEAAQDGIFVRVPMMLADAAAIRELESGTKEVSVGYNCSLSWEAGSANGEAYDAIQRGIRVNHVALVPKGRAGSECRISDSNPNLHQRTHAMSDAFTPPMGFLDAIPGPEAAQVASIIADLQSNETFRVAQAGKRAYDLCWHYGAKMGPSNVHDSAMMEAGHKFMKALADSARGIEAGLIGRWVQGDDTVQTGLDRNAGATAYDEMCRDQANAWKGGK
jgi:hypothetical protein